MRITRILFLTALLLLAVTPALAQTDSAFEPTRCPFLTLPGRTIECGYLTVPADWSNPDSGETLRLAVGIFRAQSSEPAPDPIVYLEGGPGGNALEIYGQAFDAIFGPLAQDRDFIVFDQRGTGLSEPALDCPEITRFAFDTLAEDMETDEALALQLEATLECRNRLVEEGIDLNVFNSVQNAADVEALRLALGYESWNLYGVSYGTRLALTVMRDFPDGVRSVILDSAYPLEADLYAEQPINAERAFTALFDACAGDPVCAVAYPDLEATFYAAVDALNAEPVIVNIGVPLQRDRYDALINGDVLIAVLFQSLYSAELIPNLPAMIADAAAGSYDGVGQLYGVLLANLNFISYGMHYSAQCAEEVPFGSAEMVMAGAADLPDALRAYFASSLESADGLFSLCAAWIDAAPDADENEPVTSAIPALVLAGAFDPITPPRWGAQVADTLENSFFFEVPSVGHGVALSNACAAGMAAAFVADPASTPDDACLATIAAPNFVLDTIAMEPFSSSMFSIEGVIPAGWQEIAPGTYAASAAGQTALLQQALPGGRGLMLNLLISQLGIGQLPDPVEVRENQAGLEWDIYRDISIQGLPAALAVAEADGRTFLIIMFTSSRFETYYDLIFMPAVDALTPTN